MTILPRLFGFAGDDLLALYVQFVAKRIEIHFVDTFVAHVQGIPCHFLAHCFNGNKLDRRVLLRATVFSIVRCCHRLNVCSFQNSSFIKAIAVPAAAAAAALAPGCSIHVSKLTDSH